MHSTSGVRAGRPDVRTHQLVGDEHRRAPLDGLPFERVVAVAGPHPFGAAQDLEVDTRPAAGAALDLDAGVAGAQLVEQPVQRQRLGVGAGLVVATAALDVVPVHVPLHVLDVVIAEQGVELTEHVGERVGVGQVQHQLVASQDRLVPRRRQRPLGVLAVQVAVGVHHLGLDPDAELHPQIAHVVDDRRQPVRVHLGRDPPVAEAAGVVAPRPEPTVVEHETLDAQRRGRGGERLQLLVVVVEVDGFPRVQQHRPRLRRRGGRPADPTVEAP